MLLFLAGCATTRPGPTTAPPMTWESRRDALLALPGWQVQGRIAINAGKDGGSGSFSWKQAHDDLDFRFSGPLGAGGFRIFGDDASLRVQTSDGEDFVLTDPVNDLRERYGWSVPLQSMRYWMLGVPDPQSEAGTTLDDAHQLISLEQLGWVVAYTNYADTDGMTLPHKLTLEGEGVRIRVVVERWELR